MALSFDIQQKGHVQEIGIDGSLGKVVETSPRARSITTSVQKDVYGEVLVAEDDKETAEFIRRGLR